jgi:hypothetical protein
MHVLARVNTNPADGCAVNLNAKFHFRLFAYRSLQELVRVVNRVWIWKRIAHGQPDFAIVRVLSERLGIMHLPRPNGTSLQHELHRSIRVEFNAGPLHFTIR